jgi:hypothetical protein
MTFRDVTVFLTFMLVTQPVENSHGAHNIHGPTKRHCGDALRMNTIRSVIFLDHSLIKFRDRKTSLAVIGWPFKHTAQGNK